jgi:hypothetical protein
MRRAEGRAEREVEEEVDEFGGGDIDAVMADLE